MLCYKKSCLLRQAAIALAVVQRPGYVRCMWQRGRVIGRAFFREGYCCLRPCSRDRACAGLGLLRTHGECQWPALRVFVHGSCLGRPDGICLLCMAALHPAGMVAGGLPVQLNSPPCRALGKTKVQETRFLGLVPAASDCWSCAYSHAAATFVESLRILAALRRGGFVHHLSWS